MIASVVNIDDIRAKFRRDEFELSQHALDQSIVRRIALSEIREAVEVCEVIEDYPNDKYGPSCLLLGFTADQRPLHTQVSYPSRPLIKMITVYEPDPTIWIQSRIRRPR